MSKDHLTRLYQACHRSVAYIDESFEVQGDDTFYILGCAIVNDGWRTDTRDALSVFNDGQAIHAAPLYRESQYTVLRKAIELVQENNDGLDLVIYAPLDESDTNGNTARVRCIEYLIPKLHQECDVDLFLFDKPSIPGIRRRDEFSFGDMRKAGAIGRNVNLGHFYPREELLLGIPDLVAWAFRQDHVGRDTSWFDPIRGKVDIHRLDP